MKRKRDQFPVISNKDRLKLLLAGGGFALLMGLFLGCIIGNTQPAGRRSGHSRSSSTDYDPLEKYESWGRAIDIGR